MTARISRSVLAAIAALARSTDDEICGLLTGRAGVVEDYVAARNVAGDPARRFEIDPAVLIGALRNERLGGPAILGCYHSHPSGDPTPSRTDAGDAAPDEKLWLIVTAHEAGLWRAIPDGARFGRFDPVAWAVMTPCGLHDGPGFSKRRDEPNIRSLDA